MAAKSSGTQVRSLKLSVGSQGVQKDLEGVLSSHLVYNEESAFGERVTGPCWGSLPGLLLGLQNYG